MIARIRRLRRVPGTDTVLVDVAFRDVPGGPVVHREDFAFTIPATRTQLRTRKGRVLIRNNWVWRFVETPDGEGMMERRNIDRAATHEVPVRRRQIIAEIEDTVAGYAEQWDGRSDRPRDRRTLALWRNVETPSGDELAEAAARVEGVDMTKTRAQTRRAINELISDDERDLYGILRPDNYTRPTT